MYSLCRTLLYKEAAQHGFAAFELQFDDSIIGVNVFNKFSYYTNQPERKYTTSLNQTLYFYYRIKMFQMFTTLSNSFY